MKCCFTLDFRLVTHVCGCLYSGIGGWMLGARGLAFEDGWGRSAMQIGERDGREWQEWRAMIEGGTFARSTNGDGLMICFVRGVCLDNIL